MKLSKCLIAVMVSQAIIGGAYASGVKITNKVSGLYDKSKAPGSKRPILCIQNKDGSHTEWQYNSSRNPFGNGSYAGIDVRMIQHPKENPCSPDQLYFGYLGLSKDGDISYTSNTHIRLQDLHYNTNDQELTGNLGYSQIGSGSGGDFPKNPDTRKNEWFTGVNLSGFEFSNMPNAYVFPDLSVGDSSTSTSDRAATISFLKQGANTIRLPVRWAYLKPYGPTSDYFDVGYFNKIYAPALVTITGHNYYAIVDLHSYMHYSQVGSQVAGCSADSPCPDGSLDTNSSDYVTVWNQIWQHIKANPNIKADHLFFDLVNEPATKNDEKLTPKQVFDVQVAVIKKLESEGFPGRYLIEGVSWSGLHSWEDAGNSEQFTREKLEQAGLSDDVINNKIVINVHQYLDSDFSGTHATCLPDIHTSGPNGFNLDKFVNYLKANKFKAMVTEFGAGKTESSCEDTLKAFLGYMRDNAYNEKKGYGFIGWTAWSTGHGWGNYNLRITPDDWKDKVLSDYFKS